MNAIEINTDHVHTDASGMFEISCEDAGCSQAEIVETAQCGECRSYVDALFLVSNYAGGPANAAELIVCSACRLDVLDRAAWALKRPVSEHGQGYADVFVDDTHFVMAQPVSIETIRSLGMAA